MDVAILPECYVDTNLIETLLRDGCSHQKGCGTVTKVMQERFDDEFAVGIIDKDRKEVAYLEQFKECVNTDTLFLYKHKTKHHYIIQIYPGIEQFMLAAADSVGVSLADFDLPTDLEPLKKQSKTATSKEDYRFKNLFRTLLQLDAPSIIRLRDWIVYLKDARYKVDLDLIS